jgi:hypothetical protein
MLTNVLPNGLILLQVNPHCAVELRPEHQQYGWLFHKINDRWVTVEKLSGLDLRQAQEQAEDMHVKQGTKVRFA